MFSADFGFLISHLDCLIWFTKDLFLWRKIRVTIKRFVMGIDRHLITTSDLSRLPVCGFTHCFTFLEVFGAPTAVIYALTRRSRVLLIKLLSLMRGMQLCTFCFQIYDVPAPRAGFPWSRSGCRVRWFIRYLFSLCFKWIFWRVKSLLGLMSCINMSLLSFSGEDLLVLHKLSDANISFLVSGNASTDFLP